MDSVRAWAAGLPGRHGRKTLILLVAILVLGFGLRAYRVVEPLPRPGDDSRAYYALAKSLYAEGSFGGRNFDDPSDWSPGAPLLYAAGFYATGGAREGTARIIELLCGLGAILIAYLLGRRINCRPAGLLAAFGVAVYPPFIHSVGILASEPPAMFTLPAAVLAFLWATDRLDRHARWLLPGLLFGTTAMLRPEYLLVGVAFVALALLRVGRERGWKPGIAAAALLAAGLLVPILPWAVRNQIVLDRTVPISTGGGKALYVGTFLPADGEYQRVKAILAKRYLGREYDPHSRALEEVDPTPLFDRVADRYPELPRDSALGRVGKQNFSKFFGEDRLGYLAMTVRKTWRMWSAGVGEAMQSTAGRVVQTLLVLLGLVGLGVLAWRRWWWELVALATPLLLVSAVGAATLAASRRNEVLMTLIFPLAGAALARLGAAVSSRRQWPPEQASSPPS
jgi:4-amino-4-deoxy-L-arabinose transferase-like glycosyltransferase